VRLGHLGSRVGGGGRLRFGICRRARGPEGRCFLGLDGMSLGRRVGVPTRSVSVSEIQSRTLVLGDR